MSQTNLQCGRYTLALESGKTRPLVMGILNVTPDSFSDGGQHYSLESALNHAEEMISQGADIIDIGGESSRPGSEPLSLEEELKRIMPLLYALRDCGKPLSVDTYKPAVMAQALAAGADMINDINGFRAEGALSAVKDSDCALCIMHMQKQPQTMQISPEYGDVVAEVTAFLAERVETMMSAGVSRSRMCIDPGFGFGKNLDHNLALLRNLNVIKKTLDLPMLAGLSRKGMIGAITGRGIENRLAGSIGAALVAACKGAAIVRVHDVAETVDALKVWQASMDITK